MGRIPVSGRRAALAALGLAMLVVAACRGRSRSMEPPAESAAAVIERHGSEIMGLPGVAGLYEGRSPGGETVIRVMLLSAADSMARRIPRRLGGYRVEIEVTGEIRPLDR